VCGNNRTDRQSIGRVKARILPIKDLSYSEWGDGVNFMQVG
jgi:hypothetical protein